MGGLFAKAESTRVQSRMHKEGRNREMDGLFAKAECTRVQSRIHREGKNREWGGLFAKADSTFRMQSRILNPFPNNKF